MRLLKSIADLDMLTAFKSFLTLMFLCCSRQRASPVSPLVVGQAAPWFREACAIVDLFCLGYVLPCDCRTCGVCLGPRCVRSLFKFAFDCVYQFVHLFRDADCVVCLLLSVNFFCGRLALLFEGRDRAIPSIARPLCVGRGCGAGFVGAVMGPCFVYVPRRGRLDLLTIDGVRAVVRCRGHRFGGALHDSVFLNLFFFCHVCFHHNE